MGPVDVLALAKRPDLNLGREVELVVNGEPLLPQIAAAVPYWTEAPHTRVNLDALRESLIAPGAYPILVCAYAAAAGYLSPEDVHLTEVEVRHADELASWRFVVLDDEHEPIFLTFCFHIGQIEKALARFKHASRKPSA